MKVKQIVIKPLWMDDKPVLSDFGQHLCEGYVTMLTGNGELTFFIPCGDVSGIYEKIERRMGELLKDELTVINSQDNES